MYIITCLGIVKVYQTRHPDIAANAHSVYAAFAAIILIAMLGVVSRPAGEFLGCSVRNSQKAQGAAVSECDRGPEVRTRDV